MSQWDTTGNENKKEDFGGTPAPPARGRGVFRGRGKLGDTPKPRQGGPCTPNLNTYPLAFLCLAELTLLS